jgi:alkaline phosphatase D
MRHAKYLVIAFGLLAGCATTDMSAKPPSDTGPFRSQWHRTHDRAWLGSAYWANPMEDWRIRNGRAEMVVAGPNRNVHLLTRRLGAGKGSFQIQMRVGSLDAGKGSAGFRIGVRSELKDYRSALLKGRGGLEAGIATDGTLFVGGIKGPKVTWADQGLTLRLSGESAADGYLAMLTAHDGAGKQIGGVFADKISGDKLVGNVAIVGNFAQPANGGASRKGASKLGRFWFSDLQATGSKLTRHADNRFGPILFAQHTLSRGVLKMTAQMPPIGAKDPQRVLLEFKKNGRWQKEASSKIDPLARTARFRIERWDATQAVPYRLVYESRYTDGATERDTFSGTIRREPVDRDLKVAGFTGNTDPAFPNALLARNVTIHDPDVLLFTGDQLYEGVGGYGIIRKPVDRATLNYLRKWYLFGWAFRDLMRDRPSLCLPDDHDVYQGNIWGQGGRDSAGMKGHAKGGYAMDARWVNMIQRTQTSHHPAPFDPTPVEQDISVYYGDMLYGRVSFAVLEDRKFKSGPEGKVNSWKGRPDHIRDPKFDPKSVDKPGLVLLGQRQLTFLEHWAADWAGADAKVVCSQTIFCNLANYHGGNQMYLIADLDSNGWPQAGRNKALDVIRRGHALMYAGDQHLASIVHHGIDQFGDAGVSFCVPSIAAGYPRSWRPDKEGQPVRHRTRKLANTGEYKDGLGNRMTVHAIANPAAKNRRGVLNTLHDKASGYGLVTFHKTTGKMTLACYRLQIDAAKPGPGDQFPGWPMTVDVAKQYGRAAVAHLPSLEVGDSRPVVQVVDQRTGEVLYTRRIFGKVFKPKVFNATGKYTIRVGEPGAFKIFKDVSPGEGVIRVR